MTYTEDRLLTICDTDYETKKQLYEKMGDGASTLKLFSKATEYYEKMLQAAIDNSESEETMGPCYISLALTYLDNEQHEKALEFFQKYYPTCRNNVKESVSTLLSIAEVMDIVGKSSNDIENTYEQAITVSKEVNDSQLEGKVILKYITFLQKYNLDLQVKQWQKELDNIACHVSSDTESDGTECASNIGKDINIDDITGKIELNCVF